MRRLVTVKAIDLITDSSDQPTPVDPKRTPSWSALSILTGEHELPQLDVRSKHSTLLAYLLKGSVIRQYLRMIALILIDAASVFAAIFATLWLKEALLAGNTEVAGSFENARRMAPFAILLTLGNASRLHLYGRRAERPGVGKIGVSLFQTMLLCMIFALIQGGREEYSSFSIFYGSFILGWIFTAILRQAYEWLSARVLRSTGNESRAILIGPAKQTDAVYAALKAQTDSPIAVVGALTILPEDQKAKSPKPLGSILELEQLLDQNALDELIIADSNFPQDLALEIVDLAHARGKQVRVAPTTMEILIQRADLVPGESMPLFELRPPVREGISFVAKRLFDIVVSIVLVLLLGPLLAVIAVAIKLTSKGPVLYPSVRPGVGGNPFACLKFRTMYEGADEIQHELEQHNEADGAIFKMKDDPRITPIGRLLRRISLDELPQLWNVLRGEMSLVGPRPLPQRDFDRLETWHKKRYHVLPGMTGLWQVSGRSELGFDDMVRLDFMYVERWSIGLDMAILLKTIPAVFSRHGAY